MVGMIFPLLSKWARDNNYNVEIEAISRLDKDEIEDDVIYLGLTYNSNLNGYLHFKNEIGKCVTALYYDKKGGKNRPSSFFSNNLRIGVVKNTIYEDILRFHGRIDNIFLFEDTEELLLALRDNKIDLVYGSCKSLTCVWYKSFYPYFIELFNSDYFHSVSVRLAVSKNAISGLKTLNVDLLSYMKSLSREEYKSFKELDILFTLDIGIYSDYPPLSFIDSKGKPLGILVDLWETLSRKYGFVVNFVGFPKESIKKGLDDKNVSVWGGILKESGDILGSKNYKETIPIYLLDFKLYFTNAKNSQRVINSQVVDLNFDNVSLDRNTDIVNNFSSVVSNSYGFVENSITTRYLLKKHGYNSILKSEDPNFSQRRSLVFATNNKRFKLFSYMLNAIIEDFFFDTLLQIDNNWLDQDEIKDYQSNGYGYVGKNDFNIEEKIWLLNNKKLSLAVKDWYPIDYFDSGSYRGVNEELIDKIQRLTNLKFDILRVDKGDGVENLISLGKVDILATNLEGENLDYMFNIKTSTGIPLYVFSNKIKLFPFNFYDRCAILKFLYTEELRFKAKTQLVQVESFKEALDLLYRGKVSGIISDEYTAAVNFGDLNVQDVKKLPTYIDLKFDLNVAVYNQDYILRGIIQKSLFRANVGNRLYFDDWVSNVYERSKKIGFKKFLLTSMIVVLLLLTIFFISLFRLGQEISFRKKMYFSAISEKKVAKNAINAKNIFVASMSHDIRTPVNGIVAATELLDRTDLVDAQREYVQMINYSSKSLLSLIDDILYISKIDMNGMYIENNEIDLEREIESVLKSFQSQSAKQNLDLVFYSKSNLENYLIGDISRLKQVLINLIGNAFKFTNDGIIVLNYENVYSTKDSKGDEIVAIEFKVSDTGRGIKQRSISEIFELFKQEDNSDSRIHGGIGLGLAISKKLVSLMGGPGIEVESQVGSGTTFSFVLPFVLGGKIEGRDKESNKFELVRDKKILSLLPNEKAVRVLSQISEIFDYKDNIHYSYSYDDAYEMFHKNPCYDFVFISVTNVGVPEGINFAKRIERLSSTTRIIFVVPYLTNNEMIDLEYKCIQKPCRRWDFYSGWIRNGFTSDEAILDDFNVIKIEDDVSILIAEDNEINQKVLKNVLVAIGVSENSIDIVDDGARAIEVLSNRRYDIAFIDIRMPICDGFSVAKAVREFERHNNLSPCILVAVTAHALREYKDRCFDHGMNDYIAKPIHIRAIQNVLTKYLQVEFKGDNNLEDIGQGKYPNFPHLDIRKALRDLDISYDVYKNLCKGLVDVIDNFIVELDSAFRVGDLEVVKIATHSVTGALGNMRSSLFEKFREIEISQKPVHELKMLYYEIRKDLLVLIENIKIHILSDVNSVGREKLNFKSNDEFLYLMRRLLRGIENRNPKEYKEVLEVLKRYNLDENKRALFDSLLKNLRLYKFEDSSKIVQRMAGFVDTEKT
ncbi:response regulator [Borrelia sp. P9F1]|uniref:response regulator n=1 Tax=Borrelia sp. P9F1 TaxID=3058374 RepID=UPI002649ABC8|nr:response regulator [Borrelia sp. P9F1]WKC57974.1 ATP-binding protein [Borrelia sp. P9F1]